MDLDVRNKLYEQAIQWIYEAGNQIRNWMQEPLEIETKSNENDLVTRVDKQTESFFVSLINQHYPNHRILGEEGYGDELHDLNGMVWIIDPIDGTMNFVHQRRNFAISIGIFCDGIGEIGFIYDVMEDVLYSAKRGEGAYKNGSRLPELKRNMQFNQSILGLNHYWLCKNRLKNEMVMQEMARTVRGLRTYGSAALECAYVAEGVLDAYMAMSLAPWDIAAGTIIINETGGVATDIAGRELNFLEKQPVLICNAPLQKVLLAWMEKGKH